MYLLTNLFLTNLFLCSVLVLGELLLPLGTRVWPEVQKERSAPAVLLLRRFRPMVVFLWCAGRALGFFAQRFRPTHQKSILSCMHLLWWSLGACCADTWPKAQVRAWSSRGSTVSKSNCGTWLHPQGHRSWSNIFDWWWRRSCFSNTPIFYGCDWLGCTRLTTNTTMLQNHQPPFWDGYVIQNLP